MPENRSSELIASLVQRLEVLVNELDRVEETEPPNKAFPPAAEADIAAAEKRLNFRFPDSYRSFLKIHNGWHGMWVWSVFGVSGPGFAKPQKEYEEDLKDFEKLFKRQGPKHAERLKETEADDPEVIYLPNHPPFALNYDQMYWVFDRNRQKRTGDCEIAMVTAGDTVTLRFPDFIRFLESTLRDVRGELKSNGIDPDSVDPGVKQKSAAAVPKAPSKAAPKKKSK